MYDHEFIYKLSCFHHVFRTRGLADKNKRCNATVKLRSYICEKITKCQVSNKTWKVKNAIRPHYFEIDQDETRDILKSNRFTVCDDKCLIFFMIFRENSELFFVFHQKWQANSRFCFRWKMKISSLFSMKRGEKLNFFAKDW